MPFTAAKRKEYDRKRPNRRGKPTRFTEWQAEMRQHWKDDREKRDRTTQFASDSSDWSSSYLSDSAGDSRTGSDWDSGADVSEDRRGFKQPGGTDPNVPEPGDSDYRPGKAAYMERMRLGPAPAPERHPGPCGCTECWWNLLYTAPGGVTGVIPAVPRGLCRATHPTERLIAVRVYLKTAPDAPFENRKFRRVGICERTRVKKELLAYWRERNLQRVQLEPADEDGT